MAALSVGEAPGIRLRVDVRVCLLVCAAAIWSTTIATETEQPIHNTGLRTLWDKVVLPRLELYIKTRLTQPYSGTNVIGSPFQIFDKHSINPSRQKRKNFMGMDTMDLVFGSLDKPRLPMSVSQLQVGDMQSMLRSIGRKR